MLSAKEILIERLGESVYTQKIVNEGIEGFVIAALNNSRKEVIKECANKATLKSKKIYFDYKRTKCGEGRQICVDKQSILNLIKELK